MKPMILALTMVPSVGLAQKVDCTAPQTQSAMNACALEAFQSADADLNAIYRRALTAARMLPQGDDTLRNARRAWIGFRDAACDLEALSTAGGSMQPLIYASCTERLTRARIDDLDYFLSPLE